MSRLASARAGAPLAIRRRRRPVWPRDCRAVALGAYWQDPNALPEPPIRGAAEVVDTFQTADP